MTSDPRELCILHANCQGEPLAALLAASSEFSARWRVTHYTNYTREIIPEEALRTASLFLYQNLGPAWEDLSSEALCSRLRGDALRLCIPNMVFLGYWPFWTRTSPMDFGDSLLDKLCTSGAGKPEILRVYLHGKIPAMIDLDAAVTETLRTERRREEPCAVKTVDFVAAHWRQVRLFQTVNHPDAPLLLHTAQGILACLGLPPLPDDVCQTFSFDYEGFCLPIHPQVAAWHALPFAGAQTLYPVFGRNMTFAQYISRYIDCRLNGMEDSFLAYLQLV